MSIDRNSNSRPLITRVRQAEDGSYLVLAAFVLVMLLLAALMGVDIAKKYRLEQIAQDVADAAAVAGAINLPSEPMARTAATRYIQQAAGSWYTPATNDIQIVVSPDNTAGTVGVLVRGMWTPQFMPVWLTDLNDSDPAYNISRYAIAVMNMTWDVDTTTGPVKDGAFGDYALFLGETSASSNFDGNGMWAVGSVHLNACANVSTPPAQYPLIQSGQFEANCFDAGGVQGSVSVPTNYVEPPEIDPNQFVNDVALDKDNAVVTTHYAAPGTNLVLANGPDGIFGTPDDITHPNVSISYSAATQTWTINATNNNITGTDVPGVNLGTGLDLNIDGNVEWNGPAGSSCGGQCYWYGSIVATGTFANLANNTEIRAVREDLAVSGMDNPGLSVFNGYELPKNAVTFTDNGNAFNGYGLFWTNGIAQWNKNMSNRSSSSPGSAGGYDATGNGFIKGAFYANAIDVNGQNFKVWYDEGLIRGPQANNVPEPLRPSLPNVSLVK